MQIDWEGGGGRVEQENAEQGEEDEEDCEANLAGGAIGADLREVAVEKVAVEEDGEGKRQNEADEEAEPEISRWTVPEPNGVQEAHRGGHGVEVESGEKVPQGQQVAAGLIQGDEGHKGEVSGGSWGHGMPLGFGCVPVSSSRLAEGAAGGNGKRAARAPSARVKSGKVEKLNNARDWITGGDAKGRLWERVPFLPLEEEQNSFSPCVTAGGDAT